MKKFIAVLVVSAVLVTVSRRQTAFAADDAAANDTSSDAIQENQAGETDDELVPYEAIIDDQPVSSTAPYLPPETAGTITCSGKGPTIKVAISGNLMIGLSSIVPAKMMRRISLASEGRRCWGSSLWSVCTTTQPLCVKVNKHDLVCQPTTDIHVVFAQAPSTSFVPQIGGYGIFDLKQWKVLGCVREGCDGVCHQGEKCRQGPSCTINGH